MKVVIAVDASEHTDNAIQWYSDHHRPDNEVILIHASESPVNKTMSFSTAMAIPKHEWSAMMEETKEAFHALQKKLAHVLIDKGIPHRCVRVEGEPGPRICDVAKEEKADMIVLGTRGMGKVRRTFLGSVSDFVLHHAHVPVVICRK